MKHDLFKYGFQASDFFKVKPNYPDEDTSDWAARVANALLREAIEGAERVYGHRLKGTPAYWGPHENNRFNDTHTARVVCIKEIEGVNKWNEDLAMCAQINFENFERAYPAIKNHPYYLIAKAQLDEALGGKSVEESVELFKQNTEIKEEFTYGGFIK